MVKEGLGTCDKTLVTQRDGLCLRLRLFKQLVSSKQMQEENIPSSTSHMPSSYMRLYPMNEVTSFAVLRL